MSSITIVDGDGWRGTVARRIREIGQLEANWDTYGSPSPYEAAGYALSFVDQIGTLLRQLLPRPQVSPTAGGGVGLTWVEGVRELDIEVLPGGQLEFVRVLGDEPMDEGPLAPQEVDTHLLWLLLGR